MDTHIERFLNRPVKPQTEWQGGVFDLGELGDHAVADSPVTAEARIVLWVGCELGVVHAKPEMDATPWDLLISELLEFATFHDLNYRPARICVTDEALASQLREQLAGSGTTVTWDTEPELWSTVKMSMLGELAGPRSAHALADSRCSLPQIRAYAEAAAAFYRAAPGNS